ncbi:NAD-dependent epimerase/dehydratase family protein [Streptomyces sp. NPDC056121]|uniref:NAD-dependent epimerase/dehydratase family protein n=1 Tax=Streptomyces sp. NPDC056121 TaxID=3345718 RepID=UPI0035D5CC45
MLSWRRSKTWRRHRRRRRGCAPGCSARRCAWRGEKARSWRVLSVRFQSGRASVTFEEKYRKGFRLICCITWRRAIPESVPVTGGTGYVWGWCVVELLQRGYRVRITVPSHSREQAVSDAVAAQVDADGRLEFAIADLTADEGWEAAVKGVDYVLHVASPLGSAGVGDPEAFIAPARDGACACCAPPPLLRCGGW